MSKFIAKYLTTDEEKDKQIAISEIGRDFKFYISSPGFERNGLVFRVAFDAAAHSSNHRELCTYVGSMLCAVSNYLKPSVLEALHGVGVEPCFVELPAHARAYGIDEAHVCQMDWPSILANFAYICIIVLKDTKRTVYPSSMSSCIRELQTKVGLDQPGIELKVPFNFYQEKAIRTMLGSSITLRASVIKLIMSNMNEGSAIIRSVCEYLFNILSWDRMDDLIFLNEKLVIPKSSVLCKFRYSREAAYLAEACAAVQSHPYPQFFMHLASDVELLKVDHSRFPTLIKIAKGGIIFPM